MATRQTNNYWLEYIASNLGAGGSSFSDSAGLRALLSDETGTGAAVFANTPTFVTPILGTPTSGNLSNCTAYPVSGLAGAGTGVLTALGVNIGSAGAPVLFNGAGGTPTSLVGTNISGTAASLTAGTASAVALGGITGLGSGVATAAALASNAVGGIPVFNIADGTSPTAPLRVPFVAYKTGLSMLTGGNGATLFALSLPAGASGYCVTSSQWIITSVTAGVAAAFRYSITCGNGSMTASLAGNSTTPAANQQWSTTNATGAAPYFVATSGNITVTITTPFTGTTVTGTLYINGFYF